MQNKLSAKGFDTNDFHRTNSMAVQQEVLRMSLHPCSREQKLELIRAMKGENV